MQIGLKVGAGWAGGKERRGEMRCGLHGKCDVGWGSAVWCGVAKGQGSEGVEEAVDIVASKSGPRW